MAVWLPLSVTPPDELREVQVGQNATTVRVENPTAAYWYIPQALTFIQPYVTGRVLKLPAGSQKFSALFQAPFGLQQPADASFVNSPQASFVLTDVDDAPDSGTLLGGTSANREQVVLTPVAGTGSVSYILPRPAPHGIEVRLQYIGNPSPPVTLSFIAQLVQSGADEILFKTNTISLDSLQTHVVFAYPYSIPGLTEIRFLLSSVDPNIRVKVSF